MLANKVFIIILFSFLWLMTGCSEGSSAHVDKVSSGIENENGQIDIEELRNSLEQYSELDDLLNRFDDDICVDADKKLAVVMKISSDSRFGTCVNLYTKEDGLYPVRPARNGSSVDRSNNALLLSVALDVGDVIAFVKDDDDHRLNWDEIQIVKKYFEFSFSKENSKLGIL